MPRIVKTLSERRHNSRTKLPDIRVKFGGEPYKTSEWTMGGFMVEGYIGEHSIGSNIAVDLYFDIEKKTIQHSVLAEVARIDFHDRKLAATFIDLGPEVLDFLESLVTGRLRRQMARAKKASEQAKKPRAKIR
jgi:hypothetical protein